MREISSFMSINFKDLSFQYRNNDQKSLIDIDLDIKPGGTVGIIGQVGAGKSSLLRTLNGLIPLEFSGKFEGNVIVDGLNTRENEIKDLASHVGIVLDNPDTQIFSLTVEDDVDFGPSNLGMDFEERIKNVEYALEVTRMTPLRHRNPNELSGGQKQGLAIAGILAMRPNIVAMDEPIAMLDPVGKLRVLSLIKDISKNVGITSLIAESGVDLEYFIGFINRILIMDKGRVVLDDVPEKALINDLIETVGIGYPEIVDLFVRLNKIKPDLPVPITLDDGVDLISKAIDTGKIDLKKLRPTTEIYGKPTLSEKSRTPIISVRDLTYTYDGGIQALKGVSLDIFKGEMVGLVGQNGSGKTTLALNMVGLYRTKNPKSKIYVDGLDVRTHPLKNITQHINYVFQNPDDQLFSPTVWDEVAYGPKILGWDEERIIKEGWRAVKLFDLDEHVNTNLLFLTRDIRTFTAIASIISIRPNILIIDEPTTGMDRKAAEKVMRVLHGLKDEGYTVIVITHSMRLVAEHCDRTIVLRDGRIMLDGPTREVFSLPEILKDAYLSPPVTIQLARKLKEKGFPDKILTVDEMFSCIKPMLNNGGMR